MGVDKTRPVLTISLLISNRPETVRKCLDGLKPLIEAVPCELILTDTSKNSDIHKMLLEYTDQVYEFEWCNDFAKARNLGLSKAKGEWFMYCDDDEWFVDLSDMIHFFASGEYKSYGYANYITRDFIDPGLNYYSDSWASRMFRIEADTHFKSKIHEHFEPVRGKLKSLNSKTHHIGYIYKTQEDLMRHFNRNEPLLRQMVEEEPDNLRWQIQLVQEYRNIKDWARVCAYCKERLEDNKDVDNAFDNVHMGTFYAGYAEALVFQKKYPECIEICRQALADRRTNELTRAYIHTKLIESHFWMGETAKAREYLDVFLKEVELCQEDERICIEQKVALIVNEVFDETNIKKIHSILIGCGLREGSTELLHRHYEKLGWKRDVIYVYDGIEEVYLDGIAKLPYEPIFTEIIVDMCKNKEFEQLVREKVEARKTSDEVGYKKLMYTFAQADMEHWYIWYAKIYTATLGKDAAEIITALEGFVQAGTNVFMLPINIYDALQECGVNLSAQWTWISADKWKRDVREYLSQASDEHVKHVINQVQESLEMGCWKHCIFELGLLERKVGQGPKEPWNLEQYRDCMEEYTRETLEFYGCYYREEILLSYPELLPPHVQAVIKMMEYLELEGTDKVLALSCLKEAAVLCPKIATGIRRFLEQYSELEKQRARNKKEEIRQIRNQVVAQVKDLLENDRVQEALTVIEQLKLMVPDDLEVVTLALEARVRLCQEQ